MSPVSERRTVLKAIVLTLVLGSLSLCSAREWRGIIPLKSTRADVEKLLGRPVNPDWARYELADEDVIFEYSKYGCAQPPTVSGWPIPPIEGWNVQPDIVLFIRVILHKQVPLASILKDKTAFKKVRGDSDVTSHFLYLDEEAGFAIDLNGDSEEEFVRGYNYMPTAKDKYLRCP